MKEIKKEFFRYAGLNSLGMLGVSIYILADTYFIAKVLGGVGIAALNQALPIYSLIHGFGLMIGVGGASRYQIAQGRGDRSRSQQAWSVAIKLALGLGILFMVLGLVASPAIAGLMGAQGVTKPAAGTYLKVCLLFAPFLLLNNVVHSFLRNFAQPKLAMWAMLAGSFGNIILDYIFMFPLGWGIFGAALATCLAPIISLLIMAPGLRGQAIKPGGIPLKLVMDITKLGQPALITELATALVLLTFNWIILGLAGHQGVAAYGIVANLSFVVQCLFNGISLGSQPLLSSAYGRGAWQEERYLVGLGLLTILGLSGLLYAFTNTFQGFIVSQFNPAGDAIIAQLAGDGLILYFAGFFLAGLNIFFATYLGAVEQPARAFAIVMARGILINLPMVIILSQVLGMTGVWLSHPVTELAVLVLLVLPSWFYLKKNAPWRAN